MAKGPEQNEPISIAQTYPHLTEEQLAIAEDNLRRYIAVMARIYERVRAEQGPEAARRLVYGDGDYGDGDLTVCRSSSILPNERSNKPKNH